MNLIAALPAEQRNELFSITAERMGLGSAAVVEKDFWVCWTLKHLFEHPDLSKVFGLIDRFSEDIDLILDWRVVTHIDPLAKRSKTKQEKLNKAINEEARIYISETLVPMLDTALGTHCSVETLSGEKDLGHIVRVKYPETSESAALLPYIQLEIGPLASWFPHANHTIRPYVAEDAPALFEDPDCPLRVIDAERTFWEKATILHHEANRPETSSVPMRYSRHYYDLYLMAQSEVKAAALADCQLLETVVEFKNRFYPRGWAQYDQAKLGSLKLIPPERVLKAMRKDYGAMGEMIDLIHALQKEKESFSDLGIDFEEKSFYDILQTLAIKYDFSYPDDQLLTLAKEVKKVVDDKTKYTDWSQRDDIKAELKVALIILLAEHGYPPVDRDEVYKEIFEQAENFKKYQTA